MKRILHKFKIWFMVLLCLFAFFQRPQKVKADAMALSGMALVTLNPAILPWVLVGVLGLVLIGVTVENWDEVSAFGYAISNELAAKGLSISDYVDGLTVRVDEHLKKAITKAYLGMGESLPKTPPYIANNGTTRIFTGSLSLDVLYANDFIGGITMNGLGETDYKYSADLVGSVYGGSNIKITDLPYNQFDSLKNKLTKYVVSDITVITDITPTKGNIRYFDMMNFWNMDYIRNSAGEVIQVIGSYSAQDISDLVGISNFDYDVVAGIASEFPLTVTQVSIPQLGIGTANEMVSTAGLVGVGAGLLDAYIDTAFPNSDSITFNGSADLAGTNLLNLPKVSSKTFSPPQIDKLTNIRTGVVTGVGTGTDAATDTALDNTATSPDVASGTNAGFWSGLWDWLLKILNAILSIPSLILTGVKGFFDNVVDWLSKIWVVIKAIPQAIIDASQAFWATLTDWLAKLWQGILDLPKAISGAFTSLVDWVASIGEAVGKLGNTLLDSIKSALEWAFMVDLVWFQAEIADLKSLFDDKFPRLRDLEIRVVEKDKLDDLHMNILGIDVTIIQFGHLESWYRNFKIVLRALMYFLTLLFMYRNLYRVAED